MILLNSFITRGVFQKEDCFGFHRFQSR